MDKKTIKSIVSNTIIIEKSKFITYLVPLNDVKEIEKLILEYKEKYLDATHVCYGYIFETNEVELSKCYDDGEPSSTAGNPILSMLKVKQLTNVICFVIRYFGGIKLGAGGLIRAYGNSALAAINQAKIVKLLKGYQYIISFSYNNIKLMNKYLEDIKARIEAKEYKLQVEYKIILLEKDDIVNLRKYFANLIEVQELGEVSITSE